MIQKTILKLRQNKQTKSLGKTGIFTQKRIITDYSYLKFTS